jgi:hypothetical protein
VARQINTGYKLVSPWGRQEKQELEQHIEHCPTLVPYSRSQASQAHRRLDNIHGRACFSGRWRLGRWGSMAFRVVSTGSD